MRWFFGSEMEFGVFAAKPFRIFAGVAGMGGGMVSFKLS